MAVRILSNLAALRATHFAVGFDCGPSERRVWRWRLVYFIENRCVFYFLIDLVALGLSRWVKCRAVCGGDGVMQWLSDVLVVDISVLGRSVSNFRGHFRSNRVVVLSLFRYTGIILIRTKVRGFHEEKAG